MFTVNYRSGNQCLDVDDIVCMEIVAQRLDTVQVTLARNGFGRVLDIPCNTPEHAQQMLAQLREQIVTYRLSVLR
jgi:hypothetical protein